MKLRFYLLAVLVATCIMLQAQPSIPNFDWISGAYHIADTQDDSVRITPAQPNNLHNLETQVFQMPAKGSGLMGVRFRLRGADGGKATYTELVGGPWVANGGAGGTVGFTFWLDQPNPLFNTANSYDKPFFVTYGKNGQSATNYYGPCAGGGGGATGMAWIVPGFTYQSYLHNYHGQTVFAIAAGGGGGEIVNANIAGTGFGGGIAGTSPNDAIINYSSCPPYSVEAVAGSASMDPNRSGRIDNSGNPLDDCEWNANSASSTVFQATHSSNVLTGITVGQAGGTPCNWTGGPPQSGNYGEVGFNVSACGGQELLGSGNSGGSGFCGGGAASAPMNGWVASGGGGGYAGIDKGTAGYASSGLATQTIVPSHGGINNIGLGYLTNTYVINGGNTNNPASGYFQYQTIRDTVPPVIHLKNISVYVNSDGNYNLTKADIDNGSTDNDSIQDFIIYDAALTCSQLGQNTITVRLIDFAGNQTLGACYVTVLDTLHPVIPSSLTSPLYQLGTVQVGAITIDNYVNAIPVDVSGGPVTINQNYFQGITGGCIPDYPYTLSWPPTTFDCGQIGTYLNVPLTVTFASGRSTTASIPFYIYSSVTNLDVYVDASATGANNGTSWTDAYTSLQDALDYGCAQGRTIYAAQGTYYPDRGFDVALNNQSMSFTPRNGDHIYGGFPAGGSVFDDRNPQQYPVILSGNIGNASQSADNSYQVVTIPAGATGTLMDGVTIRDGNNNLAISPNGSGVCIMSNQVNNLPVADFVNCTFSNNNSLYGGAVGFIDTGAAGSVNFENCRFINNSAFHSGGAVNINGSGETRTTAAFTNCVFQTNTANVGAGVYVNGSKLTLTNCSFGGNHAANDGGALYVEGINQQIYVYNTIMYADTSFSNTEIYESPAQVNIAYSDIQGSGGSSNWNSAVGINSGHNIDANPLYLNGQNLQVPPSSPARNAGLAAYNNTYLSFNNVPRVMQDTIDMGAYETSPIVYVAWDAPNNGDGTSWATAYNQLQQGIADAYTPGYLKDVWIKAGTYYPTVDYVSNTNQGRKNTFTVNYSERLFGGFAGNETSISQRNIQHNPTILSGDLGVHGDSTDNAFHVITLNHISNPRFDGLIIQDGNADSTVAAFQYGGAVDCWGTAATAYPNPTFVNCVFRHNHSSGGGGAVNCIASPTLQFNMSFVQSLFYNNTTDGNGGAVFINNTGGTGNNVICNFYNCSVSGNKATNEGGFAASRCNLLTTDTATVNLYNTVVYGDASLVAEYSNLRGIGLLYAYNSFIGAPTPHFINAANPEGADGKIMTADDGLRLQPTGNNYINGGNNAYLFNGSINDSLYDITGANRVQQQTVDIGAYENTGCLGFTKLYVNNHVVTSGLGNGWSSPLNSLQQALNISNICPEVDTIFVAGGTYYPNGMVFNAASRDTSFYISRPVVILGGYTGISGDPRNILAHPTVLDGNINGPSFNDNVYHIMVVNCLGSTDTTVIDGFIFRNGYANGGGNYTLPDGVPIDRAYGGAIIETYSMLAVSNCNFYNNLAALGGGAIGENGGFLSCNKNIFSGNSAQFGGAIRKESHPGSVILADGNVFYKNNASIGGGGALSLAMVAATGYARLTNNVFAQNKSQSYAGAVAIAGGAEDIYNNTFYGDTAVQNGGAITVLSSGLQATINMFNNIFYKDHSNAGTNDYYLNPGAGTIVQGNNSFGATDPIFYNESNLAGTDHVWGTPDDGLELKNTSPVINQGNNAVATYSTDITGANRVQLGGVDLGAFEADSMVTRWYVSVAQDSVAGDGTSWATAFPQFSQGVNAAKPGDTVWVAEGTYLPASGTAFSMKSDVQIYGGFNATEIQLSQRSLSAGYNSILQGNGSNVIKNDSINIAAVLDGFIIQNGAAGAGAGMANNHSSPQIRNCVFTNNSATNFGGAVTCSNSSPVFTNVVFYKNHVNGATSGGGALYCANNSYPIIRSCNFVNNTSAFNGGAIYSLSNAHPAVANSAFTSNTAGHLYDDNFFGGGQNVSHSLMQTGNPDSGNIVSLTAGMLSVDNATGPDNLWFTADDGLQLTYQSNLVNKGINDSVTIAADIAGGARIQNGQVDIGAYESSAYNYCDSASYNSTHILYVDGSKGAGGDGYSWQSAFMTLGEALDRANNCNSFDTVLVAAGTYYPTGYQGDSNRNLSFTILRSGYAVLGGYPNGGGVRNYGANNTILSGDIGLPSDNSDNSYHVLTFLNVDNTSTMDGFIIKDGAANSPNGDANGNGGGAWINGSGAGGYCKPRITNCVFTANQAYYGGAVINDATLGGNSSPTFINCVFAKNNCDLGLGGAMYNIASYGGVSMPVITNCTFAQNTSTGFGGGIYDDCSLSGTVTTTLKNTILWGNSSNQALADQQFTGTGCTSTASYCILQGGLPGALADGGHNLYVDPQFSDSAILTGTGGNWMTGADGLKIYGGSPAIDAGNALGAPATDITGALRAGVPDIGAYDNACAGTIFKTINITACDSALTPSFRYWRTTGGTYSDTTATRTGCDTVFTVNLTLHHSTVDSFSASTCGNYTSPSGAHTWDSTGIYTEVFQSATGCDSIIKVNLTIRKSSTATLSPVACGSYSSPGGQLYTTSGSYIDTISNSAGCDSIISINLTILSLAHSSFSQSICFGESYLFNGADLIAAGSYNDTLVSANGCDSIVTLNLTTLPAYGSTISHAICTGSAFTFNGQQLTSTGDYYDTLTSITGCDSLVTLHLAVSSVLTTALADTICSGGSYQFNGQSLFTSGSYKDTLAAAGGCDSIITLNLTVRPALNNSASVSGAVCTAAETGASYQWLNCNTSQPVSGATSRIFTATQNGDYKCVITKASCSDTTNCVSVTALDVATLQGYRFTLYPNPSNGIVTIERNFDGYVQVQLVSTIGNIIRAFEIAKSTEQFDISDLPAAVYQVILLSDKQQLAVMKLVKQ